MQDPLTENDSLQRHLACGGTENFNLDFFRSVAVLLVLVGHLTTFLGLQTVGPFHLILMGTLGVMFFFVHTCLVLMLSLERQWNRHFRSARDRLFGSWVFFVEFMLRRCFRIYPLSIIVVALILVFHLPLASIGTGHFFGFTPDTGDVLANIFLVQNLTMRTPVLGPMWSLPYELQMYLFLPWLFLLLMPQRSKWRITAIWPVSVCLGSVVMHYGPNPNFVVFLPCFLPGVIAYQLQRTVRPRLAAYLWLFLVLLSAAVFLLAKPGTNWMEKWAVCLVIGLSIPSFHQISHRWIVGPSKWIAKYSYGIYLTHFFAIWLAFEYLPGLQIIPRIAVFALLAVSLPAVFYHLIERPMIDVGKKLAARYVEESLQTRLVR